MGRGLTNIAEHHGSLALRAVGASLQVILSGNRKCTFRDGQTQQVRTAESLKEEIKLMKAIYFE